MFCKQGGLFSNGLGSEAKMARSYKNEKCVYDRALRGNEDLTTYKKISKSKTCRCNRTQIGDVLYTLV